MNRPSSPFHAISLLCLSIALAVGGCDDPASDGPSNDDREMAGGKQDAPAGSCADACGWQGSGACFCDTLCSEFGDCCADVVESCGLDQCSLEPGAAACPEGNVCTAGQCPLSCLGQPDCCEPSSCQPPPAVCESTDDCAAGQFCAAPDGCDTPGTCVPEPEGLNCLAVASPYCGCDGQTRFSSNSCILDRFDHEGMCEDDPIDEVECESSDDCAQGSFCASPMGCDTLGTCVEPNPDFDFPCLQAATPYCDCSGQTLFSPTSCIEDRFAHVGMCEE